MPRLPPFRLIRGQTLLDGALQDCPLTISGGRIGDDPADFDIDLTDFLVLPGIIDLHGDGFERHLSPRPTAPFEKTRALGSVASELATNGITTAWLAQSWSWEGGFRSGAATQELLRAWDAVRRSVAMDMRVQIRLETHIIQDHPAVLQAVQAHGVDYVVFNNHLPEAVDMANHKPDRFAQWAAQTSRSPDEMTAIVRGAEAQSPQVPQALQALAKELARQGVMMGSHDDATPASREFFRALGASIAEFPITVVAAQSARDAGEPVLMGAPNVVRGGSQSGNIAAQALIEAGLCDALVSDYYYPALSQSAFYLVQEGVLELPAAWAMISQNPARIAGLSDRGNLRIGARADVVVINPQSQAVEMTLCAGQLAHLSGELARRVWAAVPKR